ncbi:porin [Glaciimonas sp. PAMC28666]|uniref:porin n=1 Tax=Glaciimonas sp. PAMC28666 TaxID=2807626 RepID=UPI0019657590|nr:porin [Glaciimonas sp. PAMC28666]QRX81815.1 porin [Glaciimonas sp. PAMC28666]
MKKNIRHSVIVAGLLSAGVASAQSQIIMYGIVDTGIAYTTNADARGDSVVKMPSLTGSFPSRLGFKGTEDLGGGMQALFVLESGFTVDAGGTGQGGRLFGRQAYVGLKGDYGQLMLGRQVTMTYLATQKSDVLGPNLFSISSLDSYLPNARSDNAIGYLGTFSQFTLGATYSFGRDNSSAGGPAATNCPGEVAGNAKACRQWTTLIGFDNAGYGVNASYDIMYGNSGAASGLTSSDNSDRRTTINGYFMVGDVKIGMGIIDRSTHAATASTNSDLYYIGASAPLSASWFIDAQVARLNIKNSANDTNMLVTRLTYYLSKRTALYTSLGYMKNSGIAAIALDSGGTVGAGKNQAGIMSGIRHTF